MIRLIPGDLWGLAYYVSAPLLLTEHSSSQRVNDGSVHIRIIADELGRKFEPFLLDIGCPNSANLIGRIAFKLHDQEPYLDAAFVSDFESAREVIMSELGQRRFAYIPPPGDEYFEKEKLFGDQVYNAFPEVRVDVKDAGNCLAAQLHTAAVFHAMRVAEAGLKWIARILKVKLIVNKKSVPVEEGTWQTIITAVNNEIKRLHQTKPSPKRRARLEAYAQAAYHCDYMKDIWRNNVSHAHKAYDQNEAERAISRVRDFMRLLAGMHA